MHRSRRDALVLERNRLYDVEAFLSAATRVLTRTEGDPIDESVWTGIYRTCDDIRRRTEEIQHAVDEIDSLMAGGRG